jgi:hypothetical protein
VSGALSFTADGQALYFVALDLDATYQASRLLRYDLAADELLVVNDDVKGVGGAVSPDGTRYLYPRADGDHHDLAELDLRTGSVRVLAAMSPGSYVAGPRVSPDGRRVVATLWEAGRFQIAVFDARTGARLALLPAPGVAVTEPAWIDDQRIVYVGSSSEDGRFQVYLYDPADGRNVKITRAPYLAYEPQAAGARAVRFLNREGGGWTLDEVALPPAGSGTVAVAQPGALSLPPAVSAGPPPATVLETDRPASSLDGLFVPRLWGPTIAALGRQGTLVGAVLVGTDALYKHRWAVTGYYQVESGLPGFSMGYLNRQLAPFSFEVAASQLSIHDVAPQVAGMPAPTELTLYRRDRQALVDVQRAFYGNPVELGFSYDETYRPGDVAVAGLPLQRFAGPFASASYTGQESTPYTSARRLVSASILAAAFPSAWTTAPNGFVDVRATAGGVLPLPLLERHQLSIALRARDLAGLPDSDRLLQVGGLPAGTLWEDSNRPETSIVTPALLPSVISFVEGLRGFEDRPQAVNRIFIGDVTYRYPFIIDRGSASTLGLFPAFFLSQIDLRLFATGATTGDAGDRHLSVGGSLSASFHVLANFSLRYQLGRRVTDDHGLVQLVVLSAG